MQLTVIVSNDFASETTLTLENEHGEILTATEIVLFYLPYIKDQSAWSVIHNQDTECCIGSNHNAFITVDFSEFTNLSIVPECPQTWLDELRAKCSTVHDAFMRKHSPSFVSVTKTITPLI
jgi:hypothetical protein